MKKHKREREDAMLFMTAYRINPQAVKTLLMLKTPLE